MKESTFPIIPMSCITMENVDLLLETVSEMAATCMNKQMYRLTYPCTEHNQRLSWLLKHAAINSQQDFQYEGDFITIKVLLDDVIYHKYLKHFNDI